MNSVPHVLVVDDEEHTRIYFSRQLREYNLNVTTVENGRQAIHWLRSQPFDLVLLDILMPGMNGFQVLELMKTDPALSHIPVVIVSGLDDLDSLVRCIELGAEDYLFKPLNPILLKARINACLERKRLRDQEQAYLKQLQAEKAAAESANRAKSIFLANISHELRTPLNAIIGYSEILQEDIDAIGSEFAPDLDKIRASGKHLLALINDLLDISKIEAGKMDLYLEHFDVLSLVEEVAKTAQPWIEKNGNTLIIESTNALGSMHADLSKVRQALLNLLSNAAKFTEKGRVTLAVERKQEESGIESRESGAGSRELETTTLLTANNQPLKTASTQNSELKTQNSYPPTPFLIFRISDTGIGIPANQQEAIFEVFSQGDDSSTRKHGGTGLGLALSQRVCQMMGGYISVESELGKGSTFTIALPVDVVDHQVTTALAAEPPELHLQTEIANPSNEGGLILVIDDDRTVRDLMVRVLNQEGFRVVTTWCGEEGRRLARELRPCLILLDMMMSSVDSWAILSALKADPTLAEIPVVMSAIANNQSTGFTLGVSDCLTKPADFKRLALLLRRYRDNLASEKVLLVQEDATTRQIIQRLLEKEGWTVAIADHIQLALEMVDQAQPDLVVLDLMPPGMRGLEFIARLRQHKQLYSTPVVVVTSKDISRDDQLWLNGYIGTLFQQEGYSREKFLVEVRKLVTTCARSKTSA
jgi:signal transduction histidine kinase